MSENQTEQQNATESENSNYKAPAVVTVEELKNMDNEDESLVKYKKALLGDMENVAFDKSDPRKVIVLSVEIHSPELNNPKVLKIEGNSENLKNSVLTVKEGTEFSVQIVYHVQHEIVSGLKYHQKVKCAGIPVSNDSVMIGSYGPRKEVYKYMTDKETAMKGMLARRTYNVTSKFIDDDKYCHISWDWKFKIASEW